MYYINIHVHVQWRMHEVTVCCTCNFQLDTNMRMCWTNTHRQADSINHAAKGLST